MISPKLKLGLHRLVLYSMTSESVQKILHGSKDTLEILQLSRCKEPSPEYTLFIPQMCKGIQSCHDEFSALLSCMLMVLDDAPC